MLIRVGKAITGNESITDAVIGLNGSKITSIQKFHNSLRVDKSYPDWTAIPGFVDNHNHGGYGIDLMFADKKQLAEYSVRTVSEGCTSYLPTFAASKSEVYLKGLSTIREYCSENSAGAEVLGVHLEGPFMNPDHAGIQPDGYLIAPDMGLVKCWVEKYRDLIKIVTLSPELEGAMELIEYLSDKDIITSAGHTAATQAQLLEAKSRGLKRVTHLCNAMKPIHHRELGVLGGCLVDEDIVAEMAGFDAKTILPDMWNIIFRLKGKDSMLLTSDSTLLKGCPDGAYIDMGREVQVKDGVIHMDYNGASTFPGFPVTLIESIRNIIRMTDATLFDAVIMACVNPAKELGILDRKGILKEGADADIVLLNSELDIKQVFCRGEMA